MRRITKAALGGLAGCALVLGGTQAASGALSTILKIHEETTDLDTPTVALDSAKAKITIDKGTDSEGRANTTFAIRVTGIDVTGVDPSAPPQLGSHLHVGPCEAGKPLLASDHYNDEVVVGGKAYPKLGETPSTTIAEVSPKTEVWFNLVPDALGMAYDKTTVPFVPVDSDHRMSVVVHVLPTNTEDNNPTDGRVVGFAGTRQACFPLSVDGIFDTPPATTE